MITIIHNENKDVKIKILIQSKSKEMHVILREKDTTH